MFEAELIEQANIHSAALALYHKPYYDENALQGGQSSRLCIQECTNNGWETNAAIVKMLISKCHCISIDEFVSNHTLPPPPSSLKAYIKHISISFTRFQ